MMITNGLSGKGRVSEVVSDVIVVLSIQLVSRASQNFLLALNSRWPFVDLRGHVTDGIRNSYHRLVVIGFLVIVLNNYL